MSQVSKQQATQILSESLSNPSAEFHEDQWEAISALVNDKEKLLVVQRTGWGKSAVYFIATRLLRAQGRGITIIISPLLALMRNQIESAARYGVTLGTINSSVDKEVNEQTAQDILSGKYDAIIISPEQLSKPNFNEEVLMPISDKVGLFVIDEAHCISDWGHDFRPDYKRIVNILPFMPVNMPVLATTATASQRVVQDVCSQLGAEIQVYRGGLMRSSLHLQTLNFDWRSERLAWLSDTLDTIDGTGIIYATTIRDAKLVSRWLNHRGIPSSAYYGGLEPKERLKQEDDLLHNRVKALVATSALGMGYDKPDLSFVIHFQSPGSSIRYYQEVGRAGRAIPKAHGILMSGSEDDDIQQFFIQNAFPKPQLVQSVLEVIAQADGGIKTAQIMSAVNAPNQKIKAAIKFLCAESPAPILVSQQKPIKYSRTARDYEFPHEMVRRLSEVKQQEWSRMQQYSLHDGCLMNFLSNELDDSQLDPCGKCANCDPVQVLPNSYKKETQHAAVAFLENVLIEIPPRKKIPTDCFPLCQFPFYLSREEPGLAFQPGRALCYWGEAGWGESAMKGKRECAFDLRLATASAKMIRERWEFDEFPAWMTCVPSNKHPRLVPDFARKLAEELGIPFFDVVKKVRTNKPQKTMENTSYRCKNLDGVFEIEGCLPTGPVFLVDDAVDSRWTFTVISALLRRAGSDDVYPFAIMDTSTSS